MFSNRFFPIVHLYKVITELQPVKQRFIAYQHGRKSFTYKERLGHEKIQTTLGTYGHLYPNTNLEVAKKLTGILQVQSATESIANYTSNQHTAIYHRTVEEK